MKNIFVLFIFFLIPLSVRAYPVASLPGHYRCQGDNFLAHTTFDEPTELIKTGDTFLFKWQNQHVTFYGTAILQGSTLAAVFWNPANMASPGIVIYQIMPNGDLKGQWTLKDSTQVGQEYCKKLTN